MGVGKINDFWDIIESDKGKDKGKKIISFNLERYLDWLKQEGFFKKNNGGGNYVLVQIKDNVVREIYKGDLSYYILSFIRSLDFEISEGVYRTTLVNWYGKNYSRMVSEAIFEFMETKDIYFYRDNMGSAKVFFNNGVLCIDKDGKKMISYKDFDGVIWEDQIVKRDFKLEFFKEIGDFEKFLVNIFGGEDHFNLISIKTAIGYLLHNYKPTSFAPAIVFNDKTISDNPEGGTGKGILSKAVGQFKNPVTLNGKNFDFNKSFVFQRVELFTDLLVFDDVKGNFGFENLFSVITEGLTVEKKNKGEFFIPFENSPKIIINTNYALKGEGNSIERRKVDFELEPYYKKEFTPYDDFGKMFFSEWGNTEWSKFDNFMMECVRLYIEKGIVMPENANLAEKRLTANTSPAFIEFMEEFERHGEEIPKKEFLHDFLLYTNLRNVKSNTLTKWVKQFCHFHDIPVVEGRNASDRTIKIGRTNKEQENWEAEQVRKSQLEIDHQFNN